MKPSLLLVRAGEKPHECNACGRTFSRKHGLCVHVHTHAGSKPYKCPQCESAFASSSGLARHRRCIRADAKLYVWSLCAKRFKGAHGLRRHTRVHADEKPFKCDICDKRFRESAYLKVHVRFRTGDKQYECKCCGKRFITSSCLGVHARTHTGEKAYSCTCCTKTFRHVGHSNCTNGPTLARSRIGALRAKHLTRGSRSYCQTVECTRHKCRTCGKSFNTSSYFALHNRLHTAQFEVNRNFFPVN